MGVLDLLQPKVTRLVRRLHDPHWLVRAKAAEDLGRMRDPVALEGLIQALNDEEKQVRIRAAEGLGKIGDPKAIEPLVAAMVYGFVDNTARYSSEALADIGQPALPALVNALRSKDRYQRGYAASALGRIGSTTAVGPLVEVLRSRDDEWVRREAAEALGRIGDAAAFDPLVQGLRDSEDGVRSTAAVALGELGNARAEGPLIDALRRGNSTVCCMAAKALGKIGGEKGIAALTTVALESHDIDVECAAIEALGNMGQAAVTSLVGIFRAAIGAHVALVAALALARTGDPRAVDTLKEGLQHSDEHVRHAARNALQSLGAS
jgi:HEAT repeat protein